MKNLRRLRLWRDFSQTELSAASNVKLPTIRQQESGKAGSTDVATAAALAKALSVPLEVLWIDLPWEFDEQKAIAARKGGRPRGQGA